MKPSSPLRRSPALLAAGSAALLAASPWLGQISPALDLLAPAWPLAPMLAVVGLALGKPASVSSIVALAALVACAPVLLAVPRPDDERTGLRLRVVTHNVWIANTDPAATATILATSGADVLLLQETNGRFATVLPLLRRTFPYDNPCRARCSLAILSRYPLDRVRYRFRDPTGEPVGPALLQTRVHLPNGVAMPIATLHLPRGQPAAADLARRRSLALAVGEVADPGTILAGDFNLVPWSARLRFLDGAFAPVRRTTALFSYPARWNGRTFPFPLVPIDHVYAGPGWSVADVQQLARTGSDHLPIRVDLIWRGREAYVNHAELTGKGTPDRVETR